MAAFASDDLPGGARVLLALLGVLSLIFGLYIVALQIRSSATRRRAPRMPGKSRAPRTPVRR